MQSQQQLLNNVATVADSIRSVDDFVRSSIAASTTGAVAAVQRPQRASSAPRREAARPPGRRVASDVVISKANYAGKTVRFDRSVNDRRGHSQTGEGQGGEPRLTQERLQQYAAAHARLTAPQRPGPRSNAGSTLLRKITNLAALVPSPPPGQQHAPAGPVSPSGQGPIPGIPVILGPAPGSAPPRIPLTALAAWARLTLTSPGVPLPGMGSPLGPRPASARRPLSPRLLLQQQLTSLPPPAPASAPADFKVPGAPPPDRAFGPRAADYPSRTIASPHPGGGGAGGGGGADQAAHLPSRPQNQNRPSRATTPLLHSDPKSLQSQHQQHQFSQQHQQQRPYEPWAGSGRPHPNESPYWQQHPQPMGSSGGSPRWQGQGPGEGEGSWEAPGGGWGRGRSPSPRQRDQQALDPVPELPSYDSPTRGRPGLAWQPTGLSGGADPGGAPEGPNPRAQQHPVSPDRSPQRPPQEHSLPPPPPPPPQQQQQRQPSFGRPSTAAGGRQPQQSRPQSSSGSMGRAGTRRSVVVVGLRDVPPSQLPQARAVVVEAEGLAQGLGLGLGHGEGRRRSSDGGTHASWWRSGVGGGDSEASYPMTAVTDRHAVGDDDRMTPSEAALWLGRVAELEAEMREEREFRRRYEEELKMLAGAAVATGKGGRQSGGGAALWQTTGGRVLTGARAAAAAVMRHRAGQPA